MYATTSSEERCYRLLRRLRWPRGIECPRCGHQRVTTHSKFGTTPRRRYLCLGCWRTFTDLTGTPFSRTNLRLSRWLLYLQLRMEASSTSELAKGLHVKWDTAARMDRRLGQPPMWPTLVKQLREAIARGEQDS